MSEIESEATRGKLRQCLWCNSDFEAKQTKQNFCKRRCANRAFKAKKRGRESVKSESLVRIVPEQLVYELQKDRDRLGLARVEVSPYMELRAGVLEAEEQLRQWQRRLVDRRARLLGLQEPPLTRNVQYLRGNEPLVVPTRTTVIGIVSTDGLIAIAIYGTPH